MDEFTNEWMSGQYNFRKSMLTLALEKRDRKKNWKEQNNIINLTTNL